MKRLLLAITIITQTSALRAATIGRIIPRQQFKRILDENVQQLFVDEPMYRRGRLPYMKTSVPAPLAWFPSVIPIESGTFAARTQRVLNEDLGDAALVKPLSAEDINIYFASLIAKNEFLRLRKEGNLSAKNAFDRLSGDLKQHFKGVSVQDLIDNGLLPAIKLFHGLSLLNLNSLYINDLVGLGNIPDLTNLERLELENNRLAEIPPGAFAGLTNLKRLNLNYNQLTNIQPGAFAGLTNLQELYLSLNDQLTKIQSGAFAGLVNLKELYLLNNQLTEIQPGAFVGLVNLKELYLLNNQISQADRDRIRQEVQKVAPDAKLIF